MKEEKREYIIPRNYTNFISMAEWINPKNLIEAVVMTILLGKILKYIPFVSKIKTGLMVVLCVGCFLVFLMGYKEESLLSYLSGYLKYKLTCGYRKMRIPCECNIEEESEDESVVESKFERLVKYVKRKRN